MNLERLNQEEKFELKKVSEVKKKHDFLVEEGEIGQFI